MIYPFTVHPPLVQDWTSIHAAFAAKLSIRKMTKCTYTSKQKNKVYVFRYPCSRRRQLEAATLTQHPTELGVRKHPGT